MESPLREITACTLDCPDTCSLLIVRDARGNVSIRGNPDHPFTAGFACRKTKHFFLRLKSSHRITTPLLKRNGKWAPISWDEALRLCADRIDSLRGEPASILHFHGEGAKGVLKQAGKLFFGRLGSSQVRGALCDAAGFMAYVADFGSRKDNDITDLLNARRIVNWGKDLSRSSIHTAALVNRARKGGCRVLAISPGGDVAGDLTDDFIRIRPGTDRFLAAAAIRLLIERNGIGSEVLEHAHEWQRFYNFVLDRPLEALLSACGVSLDDLEKLCRYYTGEGPTSTIIGAGVQRYQYGGENVRFINALAVLSGNMGRSGGGSHFHLHSLRNFDPAWIWSGEARPRRTLVMPIIGREILDAKDPPVRMIWVNGSNVVNQAPDSGTLIRAFESIEFKVVVDAFMTDTAERADLFLPSRLMLEDEDIVGSYLHDFVHYVKPVFEAPGEAWSDYRIFAELGGRLAPAIEMPEPEEIFRAALKITGISLEELKERKFFRVEAPMVAYEGMKFDHPDGRCRFPAVLHDEPAPPEGYPLRLLSLIRRDFIHSQILPEHQQSLPMVWVAPDCPALASLDRNRKIFLASPLGRLEIRLEIMAGLHPESVVYRRGDWMKFGGGINRIVAAGLTDIGRGAPYYQQYVRLENG